MNLCCIKRIESWMLLCIKLEIIRFRLIPLLNRKQTSASKSQL